MLTILGAFAGIFVGLVVWGFVAGIIAIFTR